MKKKELFCVEYSLVGKDYDCLLFYRVKFNNFELLVK